MKMDAVYTFEISETLPTSTRAEATSTTKN
jgi:hypothetical protein